MREKGAIPYAFTADLGQYDEPDIARRPGEGEAVRRGGGGARRLPRRARAPGARGAPVRRVPHPHGGPHLLQHDAARPRRHRDDARARDGTSTASRSGATARRTRATTSSASTATGCSRTRRLRIYKPWLDSAFVAELGGRKEMSEWLGRARLPAEHVGREGVLDRREHARRDARGEGSRAALDEHEDRRADHGRALLGPGGRDRARGRDGRVRAGPAGRRSRSR